MDAVDDAGTPETLLGALKRARIRAEQHMLGMERAESSWREETISELVWQGAYPFISYADFTRPEESEVGADWLWWWVDEAGEAFGMLVQAKRLFCRGSRWSLDFRANNGEQMARLLRSADHFSVPAAYVIYMGSIEYRASFTDSFRDDPERLDQARKATVSVMSALFARMVSSSRSDAAMAALNDSSPLEDLADDQIASKAISDLNSSTLSDDMKSFLAETQGGARRVAKAFFRRISEARLGMFSLDVGESAHVETEAIFQDLPLDVAHFGVQYFEHVFRGLRRHAPSYVDDVLAGQRPPASVTDAVRGIVVVRC